MSIEVKNPLAISAVYLWIGFVCAISFMEAWLKFRAPGVNVQIGLGIGRLVFSALNKVEWVLGLSIIISFFISKQTFFSFSNLVFFIPFILLIIQTLWLLPNLDIRAQMIIDGKNIASSNLHIYYVAMEVVKIGCLFIFSFKLFK